MKKDVIVCGTFYLEPKSEQNQHTYLFAIYCDFQCSTDWSLSLLQAVFVMWCNSHFPTFSLPSSSNKESAYMHAYCSEIKHLNPRIYKFKCKPDVFSPGLPLTESAEDLFLPGFLSSNFNVQRQTEFFFSFLYIFFWGLLLCVTNTQLLTSAPQRDLKT